MSSRKPLPLKLSPKARQGFIHILRYTGETWGEKQLLAYRDEIDDALQRSARTRNSATAATICRRRSRPTWSVHTSSFTGTSVRRSALFASCTSA
jgi:plasmid stabilization system protein ParE